MFPKFIITNPSVNINQTNAFTSWHNVLVWFDKGLKIGDYLQLIAPAMMILLTISLYMLTYIAFIILMQYIQENNPYNKDMYYNQMKNVTTTSIMIFIVGYIIVMIAYMLLNFSILHISIFDGHFGYEPPLRQ